MTRHFIADLRHSWPTITPAIARSVRRDHTDAGADLAQSARTPPQLQNQGSAAHRYPPCDAGPHTCRLSERKWTA